VAIVRFQVQTWSNLPEAVRSASSLPSFKRKLKPVHFRVDIANYFLLHLYSGPCSFLFILTQATLKSPFYIILHIHFRHLPTICDFSVNTRSYPDNFQYQKLDFIIYWHLRCTFIAKSCLKVVYSHFRKIADALRSMLGIGPIHRAPDVSIHFNSFEFRGCLVYTSGCAW